jgi:microcystin-dependent protein
MGLLHYLWSRTAATNATADAQINFAEGMAPSAVNDSCRALMASAAGFRDDISGAIVTTGTSTAYVVTSYQIFNSLANMSGQLIAFSPHATNGATVTLNVDGLGAKPLRSAPSVELEAGTLIQGTPYLALYNNSDAAWYLHGFHGNPYNVPLAGGMDFWGTTVPNSSFAFPAGQAINRTTYATLFAIMSTTYGVGDGSTTFNLPDKTGRVSAMKEASATRLTSAVSGVDGATMGSASPAGAQSHTLTTAQLPTGITVTGTVTVVNTGVSDIARINTGSSNLQDAQTAVGTPNCRVFPGTVSAGAQITSTGANTLTSNNTSGDPHNNVQPTIVCNYIIRII